MGGRREVSIIFYRPVTRSDLKQERSFFRGSVSSFLQLVVANFSVLLIFTCRLHTRRLMILNYTCNFAHIESTCEAEALDAMEKCMADVRSWMINDKLMLNE